MRRFLDHLICFSFGHKPDWLGHLCMRCGGEYRRYAGWQSN